MANKNAGHDVTLGIDMAGGTSYTEIGQIIDLSGPSIERNPIDVTTRDSTSNYREFIKGFKDAGELTFGVVLSLALATHGTAATGLLSDFSDDVTIPTCQFAFPNGTITIDAFVTGAEMSEPLDDALTMDVTLKASGVPTITTA
jgi:predicted secreted protein